jgi:von Willebrand factor type A domain-containing protein
MIRRNKSYRLLTGILLVAMVGIVAIAMVGTVSANDIAEPTVTKTASPAIINIAGSGGIEETTVNITVTGAGSITTTTVPMDVVFAIDSSGSMSWNDPYGLRLNASKDFVGKMNSTKDQAGVVSWDDGIDDINPWDGLSLDLTDNFTRVNMSIDFVDSSGGTSLTAGLTESIAVLDANTRTEDSAEIIIFLSNGAGSYDYTVAQDAADKNYTIYTIGLGSSPAAADLINMSEMTGGTYYPAPTADNLEAIYNEIFTEIATSTIPHFVDVIEVTQAYIVEEGSFSPAPDSVNTVAGITTIVWKDIGNGDLTDDETVVLSFTAKSNKSGNNLPVDIFGDAKVCYKDSEEEPAGCVNIPQAYIHVAETKIELTPEIYTNYDPGDHTVSANLTNELNEPQEGILVEFEVISGPNAGEVGSDTTDANGIATFTYTGNALGTDVIVACFTNQAGKEFCDKAVKEWVDETAPKVCCIETVNPAGKKVPPAGSTTLPGPKGGLNDDGFYELNARDNFDLDPEIWVVDSESGIEFGPFASGTKIKYTEANGAKPTQKEMTGEKSKAEAVDWHIKGQGDFYLKAIDSSGNVGYCYDCLVPPFPK